MHRSEMNFTAFPRKSNTPIFSVPLTTVKLEGLYSRTPVVALSSHPAAFVNQKKDAVFLILCIPAALIHHIVPRVFVHAHRKAGDKSVRL